MNFNSNNAKLSNCSNYQAKWWVAMVSDNKEDRNMASLFFFLDARLPRHWVLPVMARCAHYSPYHHNHHHRHDGGRDRRLRSSNKADTPLSLCRSSHHLRSWKPLPLTIVALFPAPLPIDMRHTYVGFGIASIHIDSRLCACAADAVRGDASCRQRSTAEVSCFIVLLPLLGSMVHICTSCLRGLWRWALRCGVN